MRVYVGWDPVDELSASVCASSIRRHSTQDVEIEMLGADHPIITSIYNRPEYREKSGQRYDGVTGKPFSTDFSFRRFLIPWLEGYSGWAVFCDPDMLWTESVNNLVDMADPHKAIMVCKHKHMPENKVKMEGLEQTNYPRKNWSSLILWNCNHPACRNLSPAEVNRLTGRDLHGFSMIPDRDIGSLPLEWNYLVNNMPKDAKPPKVIHWTDGGPWFPSYQDVPYADKWWNEIKDFWWDGRGRSGLNY